MGSGMRFVLVCVLAIAPYASRVQRLQLQKSWASSQSGDVLRVNLKDLIPTQGCVGFSQIHYHLARKQPDLTSSFPSSEDWVDYMKDSERKRGDSYCEDNGMIGIDRDLWIPGTLDLSNVSTFECLSPKPAAGSSEAAALRTVVVGPGGLLYLTDGHHTMNTLVTLTDGGAELPVYVRVTDNWKDVASMDEFWARMQENLYLWLRDADDKSITPEQLPKKLGMENFQNDHYRTLVRLTKDIAYGGDVLPPFTEFKWGSWLRRKGLNIQSYNFTDLTKARIEIEDGKVAPRSGDSSSSYTALVRDAAILMVGAADGEIIEDGQTASELGKLPWPTSAKVWNTHLEKNVFRDDSKKDGSHRKGGRAWYSLNYERCGGPASTNPGCWHR